MELITLTNKNEHKLIQDVIMHPLRVNKDASGVLVETLREDWADVYDGRPFKMQYYSKTPSGLARDEDEWHYHPTVQDDRFLCIQGAIVVAIADNREGSPTYALLNLFLMKAEESPYLLLIPKKTLHGFMVISQEDAILLNFPTALYDPKEEGRIPYAKAGVKTVEGVTFSWKLVREEIVNQKNNG